MLKYKACPTLPQGGLDIGLKVGILAEIGYMLQECALVNNQRGENNRFLTNLIFQIFSDFMEVISNIELQKITRKMVSKITSD